jgi:hypothetical protein
MRRLRSVFFTNHGGVSRLRRVLRFVSVSLAVVGLSVVPLSSASAAGFNLHLSGPTSNKIGTDFEYVISGSADTTANHLVAWEQFNKVSGCASTFAGESSRELLVPSATYELTLWTNEAVSSSFSITAHFGAAHLGVHGICAYLINLSTGETYAAVGAFWTNHN